MPSVRHTRGRKAADNQRPLYTYTPIVDQPCARPTQTRKVASKDKIDTVASVTALLPQQRPRPNKDPKKLADWLPEGSIVDGKLTEKGLRAATKLTCGFASLKIINKMFMTGEVVCMDKEEDPDAVAIRICTICGVDRIGDKANQRHANQEAHREKLREHLGLKPEELPEVRRYPCDECSSDLCRSDALTRHKKRHNAATEDTKDNELQKTSKDTTSSAKGNQKLAVNRPTPPEAARKKTKSKASAKCKSPRQTHSDTEMVPSQTAYYASYTMPMPTSVQNWTSTPLPTPQYYEYPSWQGTQGYTDFTPFPSDGQPIDTTLLAPLAPAPAYPAATYAPNTTHSLPSFPCVENFPLDLPFTWVNEHPEIMTPPLSDSGSSRDGSLTPNTPPFASAMPLELNAADLYSDLSWSFDAGLFDPVGQLAYDFGRMTQDNLPLPPYPSSPIPPFYGDWIPNPQNYA